MEIIQAKVRDLRDVLLESSFSRCSPSHLYDLNRRHWEVEFTFPWMRSGRVLRNSRIHPDVNTLTSEIVFLRRTNYIRLLSYQGHSLLYPRLVARTALGYMDQTWRRGKRYQSKKCLLWQLAAAKRATGILINLFSSIFFLLFFWKRILVCNLECKNGNRGPAAREIKIIKFTTFFSLLT